MGRFIEITVDQAAVAGRADALVRSCPVDIFASEGGGVLVTRSEREDECLLCGQCVAIASDAIAVVRNYGTRRPLVAADRGSDG